MHGIFKISEISKEEKVDSQFLCCPNIPTYLHVFEFCMFLEEQTSRLQMNCQHMPDKESTSNLSEELEDIRVFKGPEPNFYILALKLTSKEKVAHFISKFNGRKFNQLEADEC